MCGRLLSAHVAVVLMCFLLSLSFLWCVAGNIFILLNRVQSYTHRCRRKSPLLCIYCMSSTTMRRSELGLTSSALLLFFMFVMKFSEGKTTDIKLMANYFIADCLLKSKLLEFSCLFRVSITSHHITSSEEKGVSTVVVL